jgi:uncharacterized protein (TIGR02145 family)
MIDHLGGASIAGSQMKTTSGWYYGFGGSSGNGTDSSGFSGLPGGYRDQNGSFVGGGRLAYWWTSSSIGSGAWCHYLQSTSEAVNSIDGPQKDGYSVRCIQDAE